MLNGIYAEVSTMTIVTDPDGVSTGKVLRTNGPGAGSDYLRYVLPSAVTTFGVAFRMWMPSLPTDTSSGLGATTPMVFLRNAANTTIFTMWVTTTGGIVVSSGANTSGAVLAQSTGPALTANGWYHIELKFVVSATVGSVEVRVEGVPVVTGSSLNTGSTSIAQFCIGRYAYGDGSARTYFKDLVVWDSSGSSNTDFLGSVIVYELTTTADTSFPTGWTSTDANGYSVLDNNPPADGVHYISADATPPAAAVFALSNLPTDITSVRALITRVRAGKSDGGDGQLKVSLNSGASTADGSNRAITTAQTYWSDVQELDPATGTAWTPVSANAAELKLTRTL